MPNHRYHIHIICADNDQLLVLDTLAIFFQARAFLTYDVCSTLPKASLYGRECIDSCDYALMLVGDSYGTVQKTGVSQMHLSYLNAKAKLKPLLILVKNHHKESSISRQLQELIKSVIRQDNQIYYYETEHDIEPLLIRVHENAIKSDELSRGWVKVSEESALYTKKATANKLPDFSFTSKYTSKYTKKDTINEPINRNNDSKPIVLTEMFELQYSAQAYEGGNLTDVTRQITLTWDEILIALLKIPTSFSSYGLQNTINRLIAPKAEEDIKKDMPNVHAVSRCQIDQDHLNKLQRQLVGANWIQLTTYGTRVSQELWKLTFYAKNLSKDTAS